MKVIAENRFMTSVRAALGLAPGSRRGWDDLPRGDRSAELVDTLAAVHQRSARQQRELLRQLTTAGQAIRLRVVPMADRAQVAEAIVELALKCEPEWSDRKAVAVWRHPLIDSLELPGLLAPHDIDVMDRFSPERIRKTVAPAMMGVTAADFCVAASATLVMKTRPERPRSVSLLPSIHVAVIHIGQIVANLKELYAVLKLDPDQHREGLSNCLTLISGPSKTADIEGQMVYGAHGPRHVYLYVLTAENE